MSPIMQLQKLERALRDAEERFAHTPGGLWLAASATLEALRRLPHLTELHPQVEALAAHAQRLRADCETRASRHELAALSEWVELARQRCTLELCFLDLLQAAPEAIGSRAELARVVDAEQRTANPNGSDLLTLTPPSEALVTKLRAEHPEYDPSSLPMELIHARGKQTLRVVKRASGKDWTAKPAPTSMQLLTLAALLTMGSALAWILLSTTTWTPLLLSALVLSALAVLALAAMRRRAEVHLRVAVLEAWGWIQRRHQAREEAKRRLERWVHIARALGQIDAFRASDPGQSLHARETRLPALEPWVRAFVGGMDEDQARRFESES